MLDRLKEIDGRAPVSIFTNSIDPKSPQLQEWLQEGLSIEVHTVDHPCPLLKDGDFAKAKSTYDRCVDMMADIPNSKPVAFRMPCCDSLNTPSPRFWKEIFEQKSAAGNFLAIDSSVFNIFTSDDPELPAEITTRRDKNAAGGVSRFRHYLPFKSFVNTIENYPYPYIIGESCWEFPCVVPSDWEAQHVQSPNNPDTVRDWKRCLDATVVKQGVMPVVFHPHGWIRSQQLVEFVDYAAKTYGPRVKFLNFAEALERINKNLLGGVALRTDSGNEYNVQLVDVNADGFLDVVRSKETVLGNAKPQPIVTRVWNNDARRFDSDLSSMVFVRPQFFSMDGQVILLSSLGDRLETYQRRDGRWSPTATVFNSAGWGDQFREVANQQALIQDIQWYDIDDDGSDEAFLTHEGKTIVLRWMESEYRRAPYEFPAGALASPGKPDTGIRLVDLNADNLFGHCEIGRPILRCLAFCGPQERLEASSFWHAGGCGPDSRDCASRWHQQWSLVSLQASLDSK